jgi:hypothetical protein
LVRKTRTADSDRPGDDHAAGAADIGLSLRHPEVLTFSNAKGDTPLMQSMQTIGIDCRLKLWFGRMPSATT